MLKTLEGDGRVWLDKDMTWKLDVHKNAKSLEPVSDNHVS